MPRIFISYRHGDSAGHAGRLFDELSRRFDRAQVFMDVAGIEPGIDFAEAIDQAVASCDVLLAVIGKDWATATDASGRLRLADPDDFVRLEIASALNRNVRVVPVLVERASLPLEADLPDDLRALTGRQAVELRDERWQADISALGEALTRTAVRAGTSDTVHGRRWLWAALAVLILGAVFGIVAWALRDSTGKGFELAGTWEGEARDSGGSFAIQLELSPDCKLKTKCGSISVLHVPCHGEISLEDRRDGDYEFSVDSFREGSHPQICKPGAGEHFRLLPDGTLAYTTTYSDAHGTLRRVK